MKELLLEISLAFIFSVFLVSYLKYYVRQLIISAIEKMDDRIISYEDYLNAIRKQIETIMVKKVFGKTLKDIPLPETCICGHIAQRHECVDISESPYWDIGQCMNCNCKRYILNYRQA